MIQIKSYYIFESKEDYENNRTFTFRSMPHECPKLFPAVFRYYSPTHINGISDGGRLEEVEKESFIFFVKNEIQYLNGRIDRAKEACRILKYASENSSRHSEI